MAAVVVVLAVAVGSQWAPLDTLDGTIERATHTVAVSHRSLVPIVALVTDLGSPVAMNLVALVAVVALLASRRIRPAVYLSPGRVPGTHSFHIYGRQGVGHGKVWIRPPLPACRVVDR